MVLAVLLAMETQPAAYKEVTVSIFGGKKVRRVLVKELDEVFLICKREEMIEAEREGRPPITVGIKKTDVSMD
jgi:plastocyanin domain-containing protein